MNINYRRTSNSSESVHTLSTRRASAGAASVQQWASTHLLENCLTTMTAGGKSDNLSLLHSKMTSHCVVKLSICEEISLGNRQSKLFAHGVVLTIPITNWIAEKMGNPNTLQCSYQEITNAREVNLRTRIEHIIVVSKISSSSIFVSI